jgi:hypothetical protein
VLCEADEVIDRKSPSSKPYFALLLDRAQVRVGPDPRQDMLEVASAAIDYLPDAQVVAEALAVDADYFVSLDRTHLVGHPGADQLPFPVGTPGDFLARFRVWLIERGGSFPL